MTESEKRVIAAARAWRDAERVAHICTCDYMGYLTKLRVALDALDREQQQQQQENGHALTYATRIASAIVQRCYPESKEWEPLPDLLGVLSQIDNAVLGLGGRYYRRVGGGEL